MRVVVVLALPFVLCGAAAGGSTVGGNGLLAFTRTQPGAQPALVTLDASGAQRTLGAGSDPAWSPDGSKLAFVHDGTVYVASADGSGATAVGPGEDPAWSPDGGSLAVVRSGQLVVLGLAGGSSTRLATGATLPAGAPDGSTIAFGTGGGLATVAAAGGAAPVRLSLPAAVEGGPSWSPDGRRLAFLDATGQVWTAAADGAGARQLTYALVGSTGPDARPAWSPDGGAIAFAAGPDLCVTDLAGNVHRLTRTPEAPAPPVAALPAWQGTTVPSPATTVPRAGSSDARSCDWSPGPRVEILDANVSPSIAAVRAPTPVVFVNHLARPVVVATTMPHGRATVAAGGFVAFDTVAGEYDFTVSGYPDGVPRRGSLVVAAAGTVSLDQHAAIRYGTRTVIGGTAVGAGTVIVTAQPQGAARALQIALLKPVGGRWRLPVAPTITTHYRVLFAGVTSERDLRVMPALRVRRSGRSLTATLAPARPLTGRELFVFRSSGRAWSEYRSVRVGRSGSALVTGLPTGRYYVGFAGGADYWSTASEPFTVGR